jgi:hypothetical protein
MYNASMLGIGTMNTPGYNEQMLIKMRKKNEDLNEASYLGAWHLDSY